MNATNVTASLSSGAVDGCSGGGGSSNAATGDFWLGVMASIFGSIAINLGLNVQKLAFVRLAKLAPERRVKIYCYPLWIFGFAIFIAGNAGDAVGLTFTAQSVITPLGSVSLISNIIFAWLLVGEQLDRATVLATGVVILGVTAIVVSGNQTCTSFTLDSLLQRFRQTGFLIFTGFHTTILFVLVIYARSKEKKMGDAGVSRLNEQEIRAMRWVFPVAGSFFAAWTVLLIKAFGELLKRSVRTGSPEFGKPGAWLITFGVVLSCPMQIVYIQKGLAYFEAMYVIPIFSSTWTISSIAMGGVFWGDFNGFEPWQFVVFFVGVGSIIVGILVLQKRGVKDAARVAPVQTRSETVSLASVDALAKLSSPEVVGGVMESRDEDGGDKHDGGSVVRPAVRTVAAAMRRTRTSPVMAHIFGNLHPPSHPLTGRQWQLEGKDKVGMEDGGDVLIDSVPGAGNEEEVVRHDSLDMSMRTAVHHVVSQNASFITRTAGALAITKGGARSAVIAEARTKLRRLNSR